ncbi:MAG: hypothetical protein FWH56_07225 [Betaproteobacteria bacterium]|nr:hypothetical protein [Betaproteobacteria bacterium]MCL2161658.1 hypothetical protein [Betaproteobacteria bacterium]
MPARPSSPVPFFHSLSRRVLVLGACLAMTAFPLGAADESEGKDEAIPSPAKRIRQLRDEAGTLRTQAETDYQTAETACYKRFFVNSCIDDAKAERLSAIRRARELEAEAHQLDLAERQRRAAEMAKKAEESGNGPRPTEASFPSADTDVTMPRTEIASPSRRATRSKSASNKASERARAARRAEAAQRDRERYEARIREIEEKKARDEDGR